MARRSYWTVVTTLESVGLRTAPYHTNVPSFGEWGFVIASRRPFSPLTQTGPVPTFTPFPPGLRYLNPQTLPLLFDFPLDMGRVPAPVNRLSNQELVYSYEQEWGR